MMLRIEGDAALDDLGALHECRLDTGAAEVDADGRREVGMSVFHRIRTRL